MAKPDLKIIVSNKTFIVTESLQEWLNDAIEGKIKGFGFTCIIDDNIHTDYVALDGTSLCEILGAVEVLKQDIVESMRK